MKYIYHGHMGGAYVSDYAMDYDELYCDQCGDSDDFIMGVENCADLIDAICYLHTNYYLSEEYLQEFLDDEFSEAGLIVPSYDELPYQTVDIETSRCTVFDIECAYIEDDEPQCHYCDTNFEYEFKKLNKDKLLHCDITF